ncbi:MucR family transcriptional regulator (plasmid) [Sphingobium sp. SJ10-10]|uniref:MucR family transcriptional regulator n=1 Tax=unclassified Sphingobium TaxID=2611147 RepID=UPI0007702840|nr:MULTISPECIES: MucR family transcriptional regulator [unclassified Sphingobium]AMK25794.1 MucR-family transcriptional regulator [Sphingobium sp. TKS]MEC6701408.1 MucR family transcriptional regulator [Sphingobium sp. SJ10-10]NML87738.1 MucR family transcriptional regulator [Sphingobium sp. TB-6]PNQ04344.1 hypothetical protein A8G00_01785 [Sphingobium sp. SA916]
MADTQQPDYTTLTVQLLSAFVSKNSVSSDELAGLIHATRTALMTDTAPVVEDAPQYVPAVSIRKSLASREHIISLIDGRPYKTLKRHLASHGLTPDEYRARYGLPQSYPLVAPSYSDQRREVANKLGLGRLPATAKVAEAAPAAKAAAPASKPATSKKADTKAAAAPAKNNATAEPAKTPAVVTVSDKVPAKAAPKVVAPSTSSKAPAKTSKPKAQAKPAKAAPEKAAKPEVKAKASPAAAKTGKKLVAAKAVPDAKATTPAADTTKSAPKAARKKLGIKIPSDEPTSSASGEPAAAVTETA